jgi:hypothetical protein
MSTPVDYKYFPSSTKKGKRKAIPIQAWTGPYDFQEVKVPKIYGQ